jgi:enamine deaminase RidA (YjgF/YER057c/UK114 family)
LESQLRPPNLRLLDRNLEEPTLNLRLLKHAWQNEEMRSALDNRVRVRREDMDALVEVRKEVLDGVRPAITTVFVAGLVSPDWLVEVEVVACAE